MAIGLTRDDQNRAVPVSNGVARVITADGRMIANQACAATLAAAAAEGRQPESAPLPRADPPPRRSPVRESSRAWVPAGVLPASASSPERRSEQSQRGDKEPVSQSLPYEPSSTPD